MILARVANVTEAVMAAEELKRKGSHEWFRGQTSDWPLLSSFLRLPEAERPAALDRFGRLLAWAKQTPGLEPLVQQEDQLVAVAQHYGLPTNFVDFTTEPRVAGFFASHGKPPTDGRESCILCLNQQDLLDVWQAVATVRPDVPRLEFLTLTVPNLWRLEAQSGVFLYLPIEGIEETIYDFDRITFPYTGPIASPTDDEIYPKRKSALEILLDTYFMNERMRQGMKSLEESGILGAFSQRLDFTPTSPPTIPVHPSWQTPGVEGFIDVQPEPYQSALSNLTWTIKIPPTLDDARIGEIAARSVRELLAQQPTARQQLVRWQIELVPALISGLASSLRTALQSAWDGLRRLPYTDHEIAAALGNCVRLYVASVKRGLGVVDEIQHDITSDCFGPTIEVEFGTSLSYARGYVTGAGLLAALRPDIDQFLPPDRKDALLADAEAILLLTSDPSRLFDFERFKKLFVEQLVPAQVLWGGRRAPIFSPARLERFGLL